MKTPAATAATTASHFSWNLLMVSGLCALLGRRDPLGDGGAGHRELDGLRELDLEVFVLKARDRAVEPARGQDLVASLEVLEHGVVVFLLLLLRADDEQIKDDENGRDGHQVQDGIGLSLHVSPRTVRNNSKKMAISGSKVTRLEFGQQPRQGRSRGVVLDEDALAFLGHRRDGLL